MFLQTCMSGWKEGRKVGKGTCTKTAEKDNSVFVVNPSLHQDLYTVQSPFLFKITMKVNKKQLHESLSRRHFSKP